MTLTPFSSLPRARSNNYKHSKAFASDVNRYFGTEIEGLLEFPEDSKINLGRKQPFETFSEVVGGVGQGLRIVA